MSNGPITVDLNGNAFTRGYFSGVIQSNQITPLDGAGYLLDENGSVAVDWPNRILRDQYGNSSVDWANMRLWCENGFDGPTLDWNACCLFDVLEDISLDWNNRQLYDGVGFLMIDWSNSVMWSWKANGSVSVDWFGGKLYAPDDVASLSVDWDGRILSDSNNIATVDWENGTLNDPGTFGLYAASVDWLGRRLGDTNGDIAYDWGNGILYDRLNPNAVSIDVAGRKLWDTFGYAESADWGQRVLMGTGGLPTLDWGSQALVDVASGGSTLTWIDPSLTGVDSTPGFMAQQSPTGGNGGVGGIFFGNGAPVIQSGVSNGTLYVNCFPSGAGDYIYQWGGSAWAAIL